VFRLSQPSVGSMRELRNRRPRTQGTELTIRPIHRVRPIPLEFSSVAKPFPRWHTPRPNRMKTPILRIKKHLPWLVPVVVAGALTGCSDPADGVHKSAAGEAQTASTRTAGKPYTIQPDSKINFVGSKVTGKHDG